MNVAEIINAVATGGLSKGDAVTATGQVTHLWPLKTGEGAYGPWSILGGTFGDETATMRVSFMNPPSTMDPEAVKSLRTIKAEIEIYNGETQLKVKNIMEQLSQEPFPADYQAAPPAQAQPPEHPPAQHQPPQTNEVVLTASAPQLSADDLCDLLAELTARSLFKLKSKLYTPEQVAGGQTIEIEKLLPEAGTSARTIFIHLDKKNRLESAHREIDIPF